MTQSLRHLQAGETVVAPEDLFVSPTYVPDLVNASLDLLVDHENGIWHLANTGGVSWAELARALALATGHDPGMVHGRPCKFFGWAAPRPERTILASERGNLLPSWQDALNRYIADCADTEVTAVTPTHSREECAA